MERLRWPLRTNLPRDPRPLPAAPQLLDLRAVAARLMVSPRTVRRFAASGELRYLRVGRLLRFTEGDVSAFIEEQRVE